jgi:dipeptidyl aminopeptidase/acylaminoacyl peptidase
MTNYTPEIDRSARPVRHQSRVWSHLLGLPCLLLALWPPAMNCQEPALTWTPEDALEIRRIGAVAVSPDARHAVVEVTRAATVEGANEWLTSVHMFELAAVPSASALWSKSDVRRPVWSPDGAWIAVVSAATGDRSIHRISADGTVMELIAQPAGPVGELRWSPCGSSIAFVMTDAPAVAQQGSDARVAGTEHRYARLYVLPVQDGDDRTKPRLLTAENIQVGGHQGAGFSGPSFAWSPDGSAIVFSHSPSPLADDWIHADVALVDVASGRTTPLAATPAAEGGVAWSPNGDWIAFSVSDVPARWSLSNRVHIASHGGDSIRPLADTYDQRPIIVGWTGDGGHVIVSETRGTAARLIALPVDGGQPLDLGPDTLIVSGATLNPGGTHIGFVSEAPDRAPEPYVSGITPFVARQVTRVQELTRAPLGRTEVVKWRSFDGKEIEGLLTYPVGYQAGISVPMLVILHGGPPAVFTRTFIGTRGAYPIAAFASRGYAVFRPNVRGSSGYGLLFRYANFRDWGGGDYRDMMTGVDALVEQGVADPNRLGVMGWSYGGYLTAWVITRTDRFRAASVGAGITNLVSFTGTADIPGFVPDYLGGEFWDVPDLWAERSPILSVGNVTTPTLIQHGEEDLRVPVSQGYELYTALSRRGIPTHLIVYPRQGHSIGEPLLQLDAMHRNLEWFDHWVRNAPTGGAEEKGGDG